MTLIVGCHNFFALLKKKNNFEWTPECQQVLKDLKRYLSSPLLLSKSEEGEQLLIYLAVSEVAVSTVLVRENEGPYQKIGKREVVEFLWENIICKFGIPKEIACDNRPQFIGAKVTKFIEDLKIKRITSLPYHLSENDQAIQQSKSLYKISKSDWKQLNGPKKLPGVLWVYRTTTKSSTGETPFSLVYGAKALIPVEIGEPMLRYF
nr:uncharacterized protein LOC117276897 [Nicotiana tomentosiformis]